MLGESSRVALGNFLRLLDQAAKLVKLFRSQLTFVVALHQPVQTLLLRLGQFA